ncbi:alpha/beta fold hydrolase [Wukongibacter baidiensis]|uniref:alpha/beta hydrolase n=1 Tax=Wukongibacter baidiensis TaxID=1723361 RepID=UPI003D7F9D0D
MSIKAKSKSLRKRIIVISLVTVFILFNFIGFNLGNKFYNEMINPSIDMEKDSYVSQYYKVLEMEDINVESKHGYNLKGILVKNPSPSNDTIIINHGYTGGKRSMTNVADVYIEKGFNVVLYDMRGHGESGGRNSTFGYYEKDDLELVVKHIKKKYPDGILGIHGYSRGAAAALLHAGVYNKDNNISFYIIDSSWSDLRGKFVYQNEFVYENEEYSNLEYSFILTYGNIVTRIRSGFWFGEASPINYIGNVQTPIMFIHGKKDDVIPFEMTQELYDKKSGIKKMHILKHSGHRRSIILYKNVVYDFLDEILN